MHPNYVLVILACTVLVILFAAAATHVLNGIMKDQIEAEDIIRSNTDVTNQRWDEASKKATEKHSNSGEYSFKNNFRK